MFGMKLAIPEFGSGKTRHGAETFWLLETYTDADWSANKRHRRSTSCAVHMVNGNFILPQEASYTQWCLDAQMQSSSDVASNQGCWFKGKELVAFDTSAGRSFGSKTVCFSKKSW
jgi:hypothetical protein